MRTVGTAGSAPAYMRLQPSSPQRLQNNKSQRLSQAVKTAFEGLKQAAKTALHEIDYARKFVIYHTTLAVNVAMNALRPNTWKWWNAIDDRIILGAVPLRNKGHLTALKGMGVSLVVSKIEDLEYDDGILTKPVQPGAWGDTQIALWRSPTADGFPINRKQLLADVHRMHEEIQLSGIVYVHCKAGQGRSAITVIAYYMAFGGKSFNEAYSFVKSKRQQVFLNPIQKKMLRNFTL